MADNVAVTAGAGTSVATDQVGSDHYQRVKITDGTADSSTHLKVVAEDSAHTTGDTGLVLMAVRSDTAAALGGTDGDYMPLIVDATGQLWIAGTVTANLGATDNAVLDSIDTSLSGTLTVDGSGATQPVSGTVTANLSATDNAVLDTIETNTDSLTVVGGGTEATALRVTIANDSTGTVSVDDGGGALTVDGTVTANLSATDNAVLDTIETNTDFGAVVGGGVEATALRVTIANDSTGVVTVDDGGGALTVDGTVTANLSATDNAVLDTIETNTDFGTVVGGGVEATALRVTLASDSTGSLSVDDGGGALTVDGTVTANLSATDNAVLDNIQTAVELIDNAISGSEMQVDVVAALPAGTNAIGKLAANSGVDIGDVDVTSIAAGENVIGLVGADDNVVTITCSLPTGALTAGDVMFDTQAIANASRTSGGEVILQSVQVLDKDDQAADFDLVFLDANTSIGTEDSAVSITDANAEDILGHVSIVAADYCDLVGSQIATKTGIGLAMQTSGSTSLYVAGITRGTPTYTASGVLIKFGFLRS